MSAAPAPGSRVTYLRRILGLARPELGSLIAGTIFLALGSYYGWTGDDWKVPLWVILAAAALGAGAVVIA